MLLIQLLAVSILFLAADNNSITDLKNECKACHIQ